MTGDPGCVLFYHKPLLSQTRGSTRYDIILGHVILGDVILGDVISADVAALMGRLLSLLSNSCNSTLLVGIPAKV
jgi:hypothetical protein